MMPNENEVAVYLDDILLILGWSRAKFFRKAPELFNSGAIIHRYQGSPPKKRIIAFPSALKSWMSLKASKGEMV